MARSIMLVLLLMVGCTRGHRGDRRRRTPSDSAARTTATSTTRDTAARVDSGRRRDTAAVRDSALRIHRASRRTLVSPASSQIVKRFRWSCRRHLTLAGGAKASLPTLAALAIIRQAVQLSSRRLAGVGRHRGLRSASRVSSSDRPAGCHRDPRLRASGRCAVRLARRPPSRGGARGDATWRTPAGGHSGQVAASWRRSRGTHRHRGRSGGGDHRRRGHAA